MIHKTIELWNNEYKKNNKIIQNPFIKTYILSGDKNRPAVIICPGGGYNHLSPREAEPVALKFNVMGYHAVVLYYSVSPQRHPQPLYDLSRAMYLVRESAEEWNINPDQIAVCGFSAGGHLAASLGVFWKKPWLAEVRGNKRELIRPDALILCYPVISSGNIGHGDSFRKLLGENAPTELINLMSLEHQVDKNVPPCFIWHTYDDGSVNVENSLVFVNALKKSNIPLEFHIFAEGVHGLALATKETAASPAQINPHASGWFQLCVEWLGIVFT